MVIASQIALVTGASRGIGRGIAIELARIGFSIAINFARNQEAAQECKKLCEQAAPAALKGDASPAFEIFQADISKAQDRARLLRAVRERFGWIDLLVNNAGVAPTARVDMLDAG